MLFRVTRNYIRHTIYCSKASFTNENELYLWFAIGIFFHVGYKPNQCLEEIMFWSIDIAMKSLGTVTKLVLGSHVAEVM